MTEKVLLNKYYLPFLFIALYSACASPTNEDQNQETKVSKDKEYSKSRLKGNWTLKAFHLTGTEVDFSSKFKIPMLTIDTKALEIAGKDGCNSISAKLNNLVDNRIEIKNIHRTKMECGKNFYDKEFRSKLKATKQYSIDKSTLFFMNTKGDKLLEFEKSKNL